MSCEWGRRRSPWHGHPKQGQSEKDDVCSCVAKGDNALCVGDVWVVLFFVDPKTMERRANQKETVCKKRWRWTIDAEKSTQSEEIFVLLFVCGRTPFSWQVRVICIIIRIQSFSWPLLRFIFTRISLKTQKQHKNNNNKKTMSCWFLFKNDSQ